MLRGMCGMSLRHKIRNENRRGMVGVTPIEDKMRESRLRWFGHAYHRKVDAVVRSDMVMVEGSIKGRGRPKFTLEAVV